MSFPRYPKYRASGVEWLSNIPEHWGKVVAFSVLREKYESNEGVANTNLLSLSFGRIIRKDVFSNDGLLPESFDTYQIVDPGDIVFRPTDLQNDWNSLRSAMAEERGIISPAYIAVASTDPEPKFLHYLFRAYDHAKVFYSMGGGLRQAFKFSDLRHLPLLIPPADEQVSIVNFLDRETAKIDALVAEQRRLIGLLKEKRQAIIFHAVNKGLNPHSPMKPSGIEWLSAVPKHWEVIRLGRKIELHRGVDITKDQQNPGDVPVVSSGGIASFHDRALVPSPGVVVGRKGTAGAVYYIERDYWPHDTTLYVKQFGGNNPRFIFYKLLSMDLAGYDTGSANPTINRNLVHPVLVPWPPSFEQVAIAAFLDLQTTKLESLTTEALRAIELLQERRTALISAAVTGKIDVRGLVETEAA